MKEILHFLWVFHRNKCRDVELFEMKGIHIKEGYNVYELFWADFEDL